MKITPVILAAGQGTRMKSQIPKMAHKILGRPLIWHAVKSAKESTGEEPVVVIGHGAEAVQNVLGQDVHYVFQSERLGTANRTPFTREYRCGLGHLW